MKPSDIISLDEKRAERAQKDLADRVMSDLGVDAEGLAALTETMPDSIRSAILDSLHRQSMWSEIARRRMESRISEGVAPGSCHNIVCSSQRPPDDQGHGSFCTNSVIFVEQCMYRMVEPPPSDPFSKLPSHAEAVRMLQREHLLRPDEFGHYNGTDFAHRQSTRRLWWSYVDLLIKLGLIDCVMIGTSDGLRDSRGDESDEAKRHLFRVRLPVIQTKRETP